MPSGGRADSFPSPPSALRVDERSPGWVTDPKLGAATGVSMTHREAVTLVREKMLAEGTGKAALGLEKRYGRALDLYPASMAVAHASLALEIHVLEENRGAT